jgi:hypothetical protein
MNESLLVLAVAGVVTFVKHVFPDKVSGWVTVVLALVAGVAAGYAGIEGLNPFTGILTALAAIGGMTAVDRVSSAK